MKKKINLKKCYKKYLKWKEKKKLIEKRKTRNGSNPILQSNNILSKKQTKIKKKYFLKYLLSLIIIKVPWKVFLIVENIFLSSFFLVSTFVKQKLHKFCLF